MKPLKNLFQSPVFQTDSWQNPSTSSWYEARHRYELVRSQFFQRYEIEFAPPTVMDGMWADGWRHFGSHFFRDQYNIEGLRLVRVIPLRVKVDRFNPSKSQRKLIRKNQGQ